MTTRVVLVDDQTLFREGLRLVLERAPDIEVVGEAGNGLEAIRVVERHRPDIVLMDLRMPGMNGVEATQRVLRMHPTIKVIALTTFDDDALVFDALRQGIVGYMLKGADAMQIIGAVRSVAAGETALSPSVAIKIVSEFARMARITSKASAAELGLSRRELEVLRLLARGSSNKEIALALHVAEGTIKNHLTNIFGKLGVTDRTQAALKAHEYGL